MARLKSAKVVAAPKVAAPVAGPRKAADAPKVEDADQTWIQYTDAHGKTHRVKSGDYKDGI